MLDQLSQQSNHARRKLSKASLWQLAVYDKEKLVAYIRLVGMAILCLLQDLLVRQITSARHRKKTLRRALATSQCLSDSLSLSSEKEFSLLYPILGFVRELSEQACTGMIYKY